MLPFRAERDLLTTTPGIGMLAAAAVISEIGADVTEFFPDAAHLASWAGICPGNHESAGKRHSGKPRHGNQISSRSWWRPPGQPPATTATSRPSTTGTS